MALQSRQIRASLVINQILYGNSDVEEFKPHRESGRFIQKVERHGVYTFSEVSRRDTEEEK